MIDITLENFEIEVLERSMTTAVLVDFWADWCGPCKSLSPVLEKLEVEYAGRFVLAKVNSDEQQQLSSAFGVRSLPTCILLFKGKPVNGFMGAQPEGKIKEFLDASIPPESLPAAPEEPAPLELDESAIGPDDDDETQIAKLQAQLEASPKDDRLRFKTAALMLAQGQYDAAAPVLKPALAEYTVALRFAALADWLTACTAKLRPAEELQAAIATAPRDFAARYELAQKHFALRQDTQALDALYEILLRDKAWQDGAARKTYIHVLELMTEQAKQATDTSAAQPSGAGADGEPKIALAGHSSVATHPLLDLVAQYRRRLSMALN